MTRTEQTAAIAAAFETRHLVIVNIIFHDASETILVLTECDVYTFRCSSDDDCMTFVSNNASPDVIVSF